MRVWNVSGADLKLNQIFKNTYMNNKTTEILRISLILISSIVIAIGIIFTNLKVDECPICKKNIWKWQKYETRDWVIISTPNGIGIIEEDVVHVDCNDVPEIEIR